MATQEMLDAVFRRKPTTIHTIELKGKSFEVLCDYESWRKAIESLRGEFNSATYGYIDNYDDFPHIEIDEEAYQKNIDLLIEEFENRLTYENAEKAVKKAKKTKDGVFHEDKEYNEYILRNAENHGMGGVNIYKLCYLTVGDLTMELLLYQDEDNIFYDIY